MLGRPAELPTEVSPSGVGWLGQGCGLSDGILSSEADLGTRWVVKWGYAQLVTEEHHRDLLMERDPAALAVFERAWRQACGVP